MGCIPKESSKHQYSLPNSGEEHTYTTNIIIPFLSFPLFLFLLFFVSSYSPLGLLLLSSSYKASQRRQPPKQASSNLSLASKLAVSMICVCPPLRSPSLPAPFFPFRPSPRHPNSTLAVGQRETQAQEASKAQAQAQPQPQQGPPQQGTRSIEEIKAKYGRSTTSTSDALNQAKQVYTSLSPTIPLPLLSLSSPSPLPVLSLSSLPRSPSPPIPIPFSRPPPLTLSYFFNYYFIISNIM